MGTHPSGPARLQADECTTLNSWLDAHPAALGDAVRQRFGSDLPFLFKARSCDQRTLEGMAPQLESENGTIPPSWHEQTASVLP